MGNSGERCFLSLGIGHDADNVHDFRNTKKKESRKMSTAAPDAEPDSHVSSTSASIDSASIPSPRPGLNGCMQKHWHQITQVWVGQRNAADRLIM